MALLQTMASGSARQADIDRALMGIAGDDPMMGQLLAATRASRPVVDQIEPDQAATGRRQRGRERLEELLRELDRLQQTQTRLATALGACRACLGEDPHCEECGGAGCPGSSPPDTRLFAYYVQPAVRRLQRPLTTTRHQDQPISKEPTP